jgi:hypothetical protein
MQIGAFVSFRVFELDSSESFVVRLAEEFGVGQIGAENPGEDETRFEEEEEGDEERRVTAPADHGSVLAHHCDTKYVKIGINFG